MQIIDNINKTVKDDLQAGIHKGSKMSVAAACFSIYAYQELKKQLDGIDELRFIFTSPTFVTEKASKAQREFYIPRISRECSLYGTEFEVKLRNELTQKAIAKECADWIRRKVVFKSNVTQEQMMGFMTVDESTYMSPNTVRKYVTELIERGLIQTERTTIITQDGRKQNGSLLYTLLPIQISIQQFYEQKLAKLDTECEQERIRKRLEALQLAQQETARPPA